ncbi:hypothetical protein LTR66_014952 [Elasticomyces elasticus]|nr:hypothetical protein LTR66_014952 [Elasticomyces elasticus]
MSNISSLAPLAMVKTFAEQTRQRQSHAQFEHCDLNELTYLAKCEYVVAKTANRYISSIRKTHPVSKTFWESNELSSMETMRLKRALYRHELHCALVRLANTTLPWVERWLERLICPTLPIALTLHWETFEWRAIGEYVHSELSTLERLINRTLRVTPVLADFSDFPPCGVLDKTAWHPKHMLFFQGLGFFLRLLESHTDSEQATLLREAGAKHFESMSHNRNPLFPRSLLNNWPALNNHNRSFTQALRSQPDLSPIFRMYDIGPDMLSESAILQLHGGINGPAHAYLRHLWAGEAGEPFPPIDNPTIHESSRLRIRYEVLMFDEDRLDEWELLGNEASEARFDTWLEGRREAVQAELADREAGRMDPALAAYLTEFAADLTL